MAASSRNRRTRALQAIACAALLAPAAAGAADAVAMPAALDAVAPASAAGTAAAASPQTARRAPRRDGSVTLDAASSDVDYRSNTVLFRDIVITQGSVRVAAERARATGLDFDDSTWTFSGAVRISVDGGALRSNEATVNFAANRIASARIRGTPAEFEQPRTGSAEMARGRAGTIEYDVVAGTVTLLGDAWLTDGRNEIRGQQLTYDVRGQRVQSGNRPGQSDRVQITIRPRAAEGAGAAPGDAAGDADKAAGKGAAKDAGKDKAPPPAAPVTPR